MKSIITPDWIFGSEADAAIADARTRLDAGEDLLRIAQTLRKNWPVAAATAALEQAQLQRAAREKFRLASQFRFHRKGLEQATSETVARYKASLIPRGASVLDACCGIGGDLLALAADHPVCGIDADPFTVRCARHNLAAAGIGNARLIAGRIPDFIPAGFDWIHVDPDRRATGKRTSRIGESEPSWQALHSWIDARPAMIKLAPAARLEELEASMVHRRWIGWRRECREQLAFLNAEGLRPGVRSAVVIGSDGAVACLEGVPESARMLARPLAQGDVLVEPHAAVYAAGLDGALAEQLDARQLTQQSPYLVGSGGSFKGLAQVFEVLATGPLDPRKFRAALLAENAGQLEWKQRGVPVEEFTKWTRTPSAGSIPVTAVLYRESDGLRFALCRRPDAAGV